MLLAINEGGQIHALPLAANGGIERTFIGEGDSAAVGDFDNDGFCEVLAVRGFDTRLHGFDIDANGDFIESIVSPDAYPASGFYVNQFFGDSATGDFDNNGYLDVAFSGRRCPSPNCSPGGEGLVQLQLNQGGMRFVRHSLDISDVRGRGYEGIEGIDAADINNDGNLDLIVQHHWNGPENETHVLVGNGDGTFEDNIVFSLSNSYGNQGGVQTAILNDFNGDGSIDAIIGQDDDGDPGQAWYLNGDGSGNFVFGGEAYDTNPAAESAMDKVGGGNAATFDYNQDGYPDVIAPSWGAGILVYSGLKEGGFGTPDIIDAGAQWHKTVTPTFNEPACAWIATSTSIPQEFPQLKLPYDEGAEIRWSGGPHAYGQGGLLDGTYTVGLGSGLDFAGIANEKNFDVLAMASGVVVDASCSDVRPLGCQVAVRHDVGGSVLVYAHLLEDSITVEFGNHVLQGQVIGKAGASGTGTDNPHLHIDLRDGSEVCQLVGQCLPNDLGGNPVGWEDGFPSIDGYRIFGYVRDVGDPFQNYNYDGSAILGGIKVLEDFPFFDQPIGERRVAAVKVGVSFLCSTTEDTCEDNNKEGTTQFAGNGLLDTPAMNNGKNIEDSGDTSGRLISSNRQIPPYRAHLPLSMGN